MDQAPITIEGPALRARPWRSWIAMAALALGMSATLAHHLRSVAAYERKLAAEAKGARVCAGERKALAKRVASLSESPSAAVGPPERSLLALRLGGSTAPAAPSPQAPNETAETPKGPAPSQEAVLGLIRGGQGGMQTCYQKALRHNPGLGVRPLRLQLSFTVRSAGHVGQVAFKPSPSTELVRCLRAVVSDWQVPPFHGASIAVEVPITLSPQG